MTLCACTVKENRSGCPCELLIRPERSLETDGYVLVSVIQDGEVVKQGMLAAGDFEDGRCLLTVPRRPSELTVFAGVRDMSTLGGKLLDICRDNQCDSLYSAALSVSPDSETLECRVAMHKNYTGLFMTVEGAKEGSQLVVSGSVQGYDVTSANPYKGVFDFVPEAVPGGNSVRLPRQLDNSLLLHEVCDGAILRTVPLGSLIAGTGYDYSDADLMDIRMTVNLADASAAVAIGDWEPVVYSDILF